MSSRFSFINNIICEIFEQEEKIEHRGSDQYPQDHDGHGEFDFVAGHVAFDDQGQQRQGRAAGGHEDGGEPLRRPAQDEVWAEGLAFLEFEMAIVEA